MPRASRRPLPRPQPSAACRDPTDQPVTATAAWPLPVLIEALRRTTALERRQVDVLSALSSVLPHGSAAGRTTAAQLSDHARYCERWTRVTLAELEDLGLVQWSRGGVKAGAPQPSYIVVSKKMLAAAIRGGREALAQRRVLRQLLTRQRLNGRTYLPRGRTRRSSHAEVTASPLLHREVTTDDRPAPAVLSLEICDQHGGLAGILPNGTSRCPSCRLTPGGGKGQRVLNSRSFRQQWGGVPSGRITRSRRA